MKEILTILSEECAGVITAASKLTREGPGQFNELEDKLGDVLTMILILGHHGYINEDRLMNRIPLALKKLKRHSSIEDLSSIFKNL